MESLRNSSKKSSNSYFWVPPCLDGHLNLKSGLLNRVWAKYAVRFGTELTVCWGWILCRWTVCWGSTTILSSENWRAEGYQFGLSGCWTVTTQEWVLQARESKGTAYKKRDTISGLVGSTRRGNRLGVTTINNDEIETWHFSQTGELKDSDCRITSMKCKCSECWCTSGRDTKPSVVLFCVSVKVLWMNKCRMGNVYNVASQSRIRCSLYRHGAVQPQFGETL